jgi:nitronate monooxygenase
VLGDLDQGLFYTGQSVTRIADRDASDLPTVAEIVERLEAALQAWEASQPEAAAG